MKRMNLVLIFTVLFMTMLFTGCGNKNQKTNDNNIGKTVEETVVETTSEKQSVFEDITISEQKELRDSEIEKAARILCTKAFTYAGNNDLDGFASLFVDTPKSQIEEIFNNFLEIISYGYPDRQYYPIVNNGTYYTVGIVDYKTTGVDLNTNSHMYWSYRCMVYDGEDWYFDYSDKAIEELNSKVLSLFPKELVEIANAGGNAVQLSSNDYSWVRSDVVIPGTIQAQAYLAWQNNNGDVIVAVNVKNGTIYKKIINHITIDITDDNLGKVTSYTQSIGKILDTNSSTTFFITIEANNIYTGTARWNNVNCGVNCNWKNA